MQAKKLGCHVVVLDPTPESPAGLIATDQIVGALDDPDRIRELVERCDVSTYDIEHIAVPVLEKLEGEGRRIYPAPRLLALVQDKLAQKQAFERLGLPTAEFMQVDEPSERTLADFGYPLVQKARRGGYDGRGVAVMRTNDQAGKMLKVPSILERAVDIDKEVAVIVARGRDGQCCAYPVVEMVFDPEANLLDTLLAPAQVDAEKAEQARGLAVATVDALEGIGVFGVEMFLAKDGQLLVNEIAPRPHNSGHYTIEACLTSQFEQHVRAILDLPLGSTRQHTPCAMVNLLGQPGGAGQPRLEGLREAMAIPGASIHLYGKAEVRPFRKMGHVTVLDESLESAREKALRARQLLRIKAKDEG
jgi:5-(carboxyamino)imidazole ribonucleotide synthase